LLEFRVGTTRDRTGLMGGGEMAENETTNALTDEQKERIRLNKERALEIQRRRKLTAEELEDFEVDASPWVNKMEAMKVYCLPEGTLVVCAFEERENPRNKGWTPMKLYHRAEIRRRARERFGGLQGLVEERKKREERKFQKDFDKAKNMFA
jgi:hypothetical protein